LRFLIRPERQSLSAGSGSFDVVQVAAMLFLQPLNGMKVAAGKAPGPHGPDLAESLHTAWRRKPVFRSLRIVPIEFMDRRIPGSKDG